MRRGWVWNRDKVTRSLAIAAAFALCATASAFAADPIKIGHVAALSGASAQSGEAITRGLSLAIDEINAKGGLLGGRMLELVQRDDESTPPKGLVAAQELLADNVAAVFAGIDTPGVDGDGAAPQQGEAHLHRRVGRWHPRSRTTAPIPTTLSASQRSTRWSMSSCSNSRIRSLVRRRQAWRLSTIPGVSRTKKGCSPPPADADPSIKVAAVEKVREQRRRHGTATDAAQGRRGRLHYPGC